MKKIFLLIVMVSMFVSLSFAKESIQSCPVRGAGDIVVSLSQPSHKANKKGKVDITACISLPSENTIAVFVEVRDENYELIGTHRLEFAPREVCITNIDPKCRYENINIEFGKTYYYSIARASCVSGW